MVVTIVVVAEAEMTVAAAAGESIIVIQKEKQVGAVANVDGGDVVRIVYWNLKELQALSKSYP